MALNVQNDLKTTPYYLDWQDRTPELEEKITNIFSRLALDDDSHWSTAKEEHNGKDVYRLCNVREYHLVKTAILESLLESPDQTDFYAMDVGAGRFQWISGVANFLNQQQDLPANIKIHLLGVRGEAYRGKKIIQKGKCTLYFLGAFQIENFLHALNNTKIKEISAASLMGRVNVIVNCRTLFHLADSLGTMLIMLALLRPKIGFIVGDEFAFLAIQPSKKAHLNQDFIQLFIDTRAQFFISYNGKDKCLNYVVKKQGQIQLPMSYRDTMPFNEGSSRTLTVFDRMPQPTDRIYVVPDENNHYVGNENLYRWFQKNALFYNKTKWVDSIEEIDTPPIPYLAVAEGEEKEAS